VKEPSGYVENGDVRIAYWERGQGPSLLLIMGVNMRAAHWGEQFLSALAERYHVVCFDNRGTGDSTKSVDDIRAESWASDGLAVLDSVGVQRAHVLGFSMGGYIAQWIAVHAPDRVDRLVLLASAVGGKRATAATPEGMAALVAPSGKTADEARANSLKVTSAPGFADRHPDRLAKLVELGGTKRTPAKVLHKQVRVGGNGLYEELAELAMPTAIVSGDSDVLVPLGNGKTLHGLIPGASLSVLERCGHLPTWEAPEQVLKIVCSFLGGSNDEDGDVGASQPSPADH
jgi:pimeloyl-ACP methyl ester carboxylesterase